jgi:hypothetical protein
MQGFLLFKVSEANGSWFAYGQKPVEFIQGWKYFVDTVRSKNRRDMVAFIWAPNSGNGYPFPNSFYSAVVTDPKFEWELDTNKDGVFDGADDPYSPFYPGGISFLKKMSMLTGLACRFIITVKFILGRQTLFHELDRLRLLSLENRDGEISVFMTCFVHHLIQKPQTSPKEANLFSLQKLVIYIYKGATTHLFVIKDDPNYPFPAVVNQTERVSVRNGGRPAVDPHSLPTGGRWIIPQNTSAADRVAQKQTWWRQYLNETFLAQFPQVKGVCTFEFFKFEESSFRDFTNFGAGPNEKGPNGYQPEGAHLVLKAFQDDMRAGYDRFIIWSNYTAAHYVGLYVGISVGVVIAIAAAIGVLYWLKRKRGLNTSSSKMNLIVVNDHDGNSDARTYVQNRY